MGERVVVLKKGDQRIELRLRVKKVNPIKERRIPHYNFDNDIGRGVRPVKGFLSNGQVETEVDETNNGQKLPFDGDPVVDEVLVQQQGIQERFENKAACSQRKAYARFLRDNKLEPND